MFDGTATAFGPNLITNGDFATDATGWELRDVGVWSAGKVTVTYADGDYAGVETTFATEAGKWYEASFTISALAGDTVYAYNDGGLTSYSDEFTSNGTYTYVFKAGASTTTLIVELWNWNSGASFSIDDASVRETDGTDFVVKNVFGEIVISTDSLLNDVVTLGHGANPNAVRTNVSIGTLALNSVTTGDVNIAIGYSALRKLTESYLNTAIGYYALGELTTGYENIAIGGHAAEKVTTGGLNTAVGSEALSYGPGGTASGSTAIGYRSLWFANGGNNTGLGAGTGQGHPSSQETPFTGTNNTFVGAGAGTSDNQKLDAYSSTALGYGACTTKDNQVVIGKAGTNWSQGATYETVIHGDVRFKSVKSSVTPEENGEIALEVTSDTQVKLKLKGSDGTVRSVTLTLS